MRSLELMMALFPAPTFYVTAAMVRTDEGTMLNWQRKWIVTHLGKKDAEPSPWAILSEKDADEAIAKEIEVHSYLTRIATCLENNHEKISLYEAMKYNETAVRLAKAHKEIVSHLKVWAEKNS